MEFEILLRILRGPFLISSSLFLFILFPLWVKTISPILNSCSLLFLSYFCLLISKCLVEFLNASSLSLSGFILFSIIPLGTISIIFPYSKWFGANPVTLCLVLLYSSTLSSAIFVQFLFFFELILYLMLFTNVWFTLSFSPLEDGQSVEVKINLMFFFLAYSNFFGCHYWVSICTDNFYGISFSNLHIVPKFPLGYLLTVYFLFRFYLGFR